MMAMHRSACVCALLGSLLAQAAPSAGAQTTSPLLRAAVVRVEAAVDPFSLGPDLAADLGSQTRWTSYEKELGRRLAMGGTGTGFFINQEGDLLTNAHVVLSGVRFRGLHFSSREWDSMRLLLKSVRDIWVTVGEGEESRSYLAVPVALAEDLDLAVLRVVTPPSDPTAFVPLAIRRSPELRVGEKLSALGFPNDGFVATSGEILSLIRGPEVHSDMSIVQTVDPRTGEASIRVAGPPTGPVGRLQHSAPTGHGSSGGPLVDSQGHVIGIAYALLSDGNGETRADLNLGIISSVIVEFLQGHGIRFVEASS
jgi:S1-C subfamily serine protease